MKNYIFISLLFFTAYIASAQEPVPFDKSKLTDDEKALIEKFRTTTGKEKFDAFRKVSHIFPRAETSIKDGDRVKIKGATLKVKMTQEQLIDLLGTPSEIRTAIVDYYFTEANADCNDFCKVSFFLTDGQVVGFGYAGNLYAKWMNIQAYYFKCDSTISGPETKFFYKENLTSDELANLAKFRTSTGKEKFDAFMAVSHIFPAECKATVNQPKNIARAPQQPDVIMTIDQLTDLLGKGKQNGAAIEYYISGKAKKGNEPCKVSFLISNNRVQAWLLEGAECSQWFDVPGKK